MGSTFPFRSLKPRIVLSGTLPRLGLQNCNRRVEPTVAAISSPWQAERAATLQRLCQRIRARVDDGQPLLKAVRREARRYQGRPFRTDSKHRWALSPGTLLRWWHRWRRNGEVPSAFKLHYAARATSVPLPVMTRFICFCATYLFHSQFKAWVAFAKVEDRRWIHLRPVRPSRIYRFSSVRRYFTAAAFRKLQVELKSISSHQKELGRLRLLFCADQQRRLPAPAARHRRTGQEYEI